MTLELHHLNKTFDGHNDHEAIHVLEDIHYRMQEGEFVSIVGPSGCGKTTLLRIIAGLETPSSGKVLIDGRDIFHKQDRIGLVFQEYALFPWRTTLKNIEMGLEIIGLPKKERTEKAMAYVRQFGLSGFEHAYPRALSGGMQQRVAIARTLITDPRVVLMDEPFGSLDSQTRDDMQSFLLGLWEEQKGTILFVTHNVDEAVFLSDRIVVLSRRPSKITRIFEVDCPRPRDRTGAACNAARREVLQTLEKQRQETGDLRMVASERPNAQSRQSKRTESFMEM
jgi:NitT/TauT family transport system ATP-binding protein